MWPFRRRLSVSSPELVSAVPIPQDIIVANECKCSQAECSQQDKLNSWTPNTPPSSATSSARKSISTWGRKVGRKWDDIKRSDSSELLSVSSRRRHWSPNRSTIDVLNNSSSQNESVQFLKPKRILRVKSLRHLFRHAADKCESKGETIREEDNYVDYKMDKSLSEGAIRISTSLHSQSEAESLNKSKRLFSYSTHDIDKRDDLEYFLNNTDTIRPKMQVKAGLLKKRGKCESVADLTLNCNVALPNDRTERNDQGKSIICKGLEDLVSNMKIGCDESGYDSDSTRTGADSPDCEKANLKCRSNSITSEDYRTIELTVGKVNVVENEAPSSTQQSISLASDLSVLMEDNGDNDVTLKANESECDVSTSVAAASNEFDDIILSQTQTPKKKLSIRASDSKCLRKKYKYRDSATINLLDESSSPCQETPPIEQLVKSAVPTIPYYVPKRTCDSSLQQSEQTFKRLALEQKTLLTSSQSTKQSLFKVEYKMIQLKISSGNLGICIEEKENGRLGYVIAKMDPNGDAAKSGLFRIGDEILRVSGKRLKRIALAEARRLLQNSSGDVQFYIGRQPSILSFTGEGEDALFDWPEKKSPKSCCSTTSDDAIWTRKDCRTMDMSCEIIGFHRKDGQFVAVDDFGELPEERKEKVTGMKKFHVRKRASNADQHSRRALSLSMDTVTVILEKGGKKKLGFSIVGGSDSEKGNVGIYVKNTSLEGQAANCLRSGDQILAINGTSMQGLTHAQALQTIKAAKPGQMMIHIRRRDTANIKRLHRL